MEITQKAVMSMAIPSCMCHGKWSRSWTQSRTSALIIETSSYVSLRPSDLYRSVTSPWKLSSPSHPRTEQKKSCPAGDGTQVTVRAMPIALTHSATVTTR